MPFISSSSGFSDADKARLAALRAERANFELRAEIKAYRAELTSINQPLTMRERILVGAGIGCFVVALGVVSGWDFEANKTAHVAVVPCIPPVGNEVLVVVADVAAVRGYRCVISNNAVLY